MNTMQTIEEGQRGRPASDNRSLKTGLGRQDQFDAELEFFILRAIADALAADLGRASEAYGSIQQGKQPSEVANKR